MTKALALGHSLGCDHSWGDSSQQYHTHYGWRLEPPGATRVRTIMAYPALARQTPREDIYVIDGNITCRAVAEAHGLVHAALDL